MPDADGAPYSRGTSRFLAGFYSPIPHRDVCIEGQSLSHSAKDGIMMMIRMDVLSI